MSHDDSRSTRFSIDRRRLGLAAAGGVLAALTGSRAAAQSGSSEASLTAPHVVRLSPDGHWLASVHDDETIRLWDLRQGTMARAIAGPPNGVGAIAFSPDSRLLAIGNRPRRVRGKGGSLELREVESGRLVRAGTAEPPYQWVSGIAFSADGRRIVTSGGLRSLALVVWSSATLRPIGSLAPDPLQSGRGEIAYRPDGRSIVSVASPLRRMPQSEMSAIVPEVEIWSADLRRRLGRAVFGNHGSRVYDISRDGTLVAGAVGVDRTSVVVHELGTGREVARLGIERPIAPGAHLSVRFSPNGQMVGIGAPGGYLSLHSVAGGNELWSVATGGEVVTDLALSPDGQRLAIARSAGTVQIRSAANGNLLGELLALAANGWIAVAADGSYAASADARRRVGAGGDLVGRLTARPAVHKPEGIGGALARD
jgi:WD40 repeat protein